MVPPHRGSSAGHGQCVMVLFGLFWFGLFVFVFGFVFWYEQEQFLKRKNKRQVL